MVSDEEFRAWMQNMSAKLNAVVTAIENLENSLTNMLDDDEDSEDADDELVGHKHPKLRED